MPRGLSMTIAELVDELMHLERKGVTELRGLALDVRSYRGFYEDVAIATGEGVRIDELLELLRDSIGERFHGYKGGLYLCTFESAIWVADWGKCGSPIGEVVVVDGVAELRPGIYEGDWE